MIFDDATLAQVGAARPDTSTWLSANAGSGKTRVLTDRVARLLLDGVPPERILCLTYTKAAAMEMQNRLFERLGQWAMKPDDDLRAALVQTGVDEPLLDVRLLGRARTLFARAIEAPGGLKIQTIHSFCASVLRRFPLEAGVSPGFTEIDERVQKRLIADLLDRIADDALTRPALDGVAPLLSDEESAIRLAQAVARHTEALVHPMDWPEICDWCGIPADLTDDVVLAQVLTGDEAEICNAFWPLLDPENKAQAKPRRLLQAMPWHAMQLSHLAELEGVFLTGPTAKAPYAAKIDGIGNKATRDKAGAEVMDRLNALMERIEAARPLRTGLVTARRTEALHRFAAAFLPAYAQAKQARGWLDFDDLIARTGKLLTAPGVAQWVLFRLDGGIDHILVDEAQDTSPEQWQIVAQLADDFAAGEGARADIARTIFVVGDKKQSIYSFQGADPAEFDRMRAHFEARLAEIGAPFQAEDLIWSFRSAPPILQLVDAVSAGLGAPGLGAGVVHRAYFGDRPGRVDLWPLVPKTEKPEDIPWDSPQDIVSDDHHTSVLAKALARRIKDMLDHPPEITVGKIRRALEAGDILILVRRRSPLFRKIIAEIKTLTLPIAGVDRSQLTAPLAVKDLLALLRFLATPEDDLSLAAILRSPIFGWDEAQLFDLAHGRDGGLWPALRSRAEEWPETVAILQDLFGQADFIRPYDLLERALIRHDARRRLIAQLGPEAEDAIDAMLAQALAYEEMEVPSLTGFVGWLEAGEVQVKRDLAQAKGQIRVMTVHGAKGLEAPVVILPDCAQAQGPGPGVHLIRTEGGALTWPPSQSDQTVEVAEALAAEKSRAGEEANRLLYVALTRAESWLIVAAAGQVGKQDDGSWYNIVENAMTGLGPVPLDVPELPGLSGGMRLETGGWPVVARPAPRSDGRALLPDWADRAAPPVPKDRPARTPSDLGGAKALPGEGAGLTEAQALRRGRLVHLLLEHLPRLPAPAWAATAPAIAALEAADVSSEELGALLDEAIAVLTAPHLAHLFAPDTLAEVEIVGESAVLDAPVLGVIDRLIVSDTRVLAVDFKTNAVVPTDPAEVPDGLLRQMGAYAELLAAIYPGREVVTAILWSRTGALMELPHDLVSDALLRARGA